MRVPNTAIPDSERICLKPDLLEQLRNHSLEALNDQRVGWGRTLAADDRRVLGLGLQLQAAKEESFVE